MKKILLTIAACIAVATCSYGQLTQDFETPTVSPALPTGWTNNSTGTPGWQTGSNAGSTWGSLTGAYNIPAHTQYAYIDDAVNHTQLHDTMKSPVFTGLGSGVYLAYDYFFYKAQVTSSGISESAYVLGSSDGGATWQVLDTLMAVGVTNKWYTGHANLSSLTGANCMVAFTYSDGGASVLGVAIDNVIASTLTSTAAAVTSINYNDSISRIATNNTPISFTVRNDGLTITSFKATFNVNGGGAVSQNFSSVNIAPYTSQTFTFTTNMTGAIAGSNTIQVGVSDINTSPAANPDADSITTRTFTYASTSTQRQGLIEEFSSSTCAPCKAFNTSYDPLCVTLNADVTGSNFNIVKYQMNWPSPGTDYSYNPDGLARRTYYNINSIPGHFVNGKLSAILYNTPFTGANTTALTNEITGSASNKAFIDMTVSYKVDTVQKKLYATTTLTPHFTKTGSYHVYVASMDKHYQNTANTTGQLDYNHVMRKMLPSSSGHAVSSWTDGTPIVYNDSIVYTNGDWTKGSSAYPTQGSYKFWSSPLNGELIAFVEEDATKYVMQSFLTFPVLSITGISNVGTSSQVGAISVYPNPASTNATLHFNLLETGNVHITVIDVAGRKLLDVVNASMSAGTQTVNISTEYLPAGDHLIYIETEGGNNMTRLSVIK